MIGTRPARVAVAALGLVLVGCGDPATDEAERQAEQARREAAFCIGFPARDAGAPLDILDDPELGQSVAVTAELLGWVAKTTEADAPPELKPSVIVYVAALRDYDGTADPRDDREVRDAVSSIDAWLAEHCGPPDTGAPPGTPP